MAAPLQGLPSWLATPPIDSLAPLQSFMQGFQSGSAAAAQQAQRAQQAAQFSQELGQRQLKAQQDYELEQQGQQIRNQQLAQQLLHQRAMEARAMQESQSLAAHRLAQERQAQATAAGLETWRKAQQEHNAATLAETKRFHEQTATKPTALSQDIQMIGKLRDDAKRFREEGDTAKAENAEYQLSLIEGKMLGPSETVEVQSPEGHIVRTTRGGKPGATGADLTTATKTKLQEERLKREDPMAMIAHIERNMNAADFGLRGVVGDFMDRWVAQIKPEAADPRRESVRNSLKLLRTDLYKTLRSDSNIGVKEVEEIRNMLPSERMNESLPHAAQTLADVKRRMIDAERRGSAALGVTPHIWALTPLEIKQQMKAGKITEADAVNALLRYHLKAVQEAP